MAPLLTTSEVASLFAVSRRSIRLWAECGELRGIKVGRQWRFRDVAVQRWLAEREPGLKNIPLSIQQLPESSAITESTANRFHGTNPSSSKVGKSKRVWMARKVEKTDGLIPG